MVRPPRVCRSLACLLFATGWAFGAETAATAGRLLRGAVDLHCHSGPDVVPRAVNDLELARAARAAGLRAIVIKNHHTGTADRAELAQAAVGDGIAVFGGLVLNRAVGGLNAEAVHRMATMTGRRGRIVWLPTFDAENAVRSEGSARPSIPLVADGRPVPAVMAVLAAVAEHGLVLATGHASAEEALAIVPAARAAGIRHVVVTHALFPALGTTDEHLAALARLGAWLEFSWLMHAPPASVPLARCVAAIRAAGPASVVLSSDFGQAVNPPPPDGLRAFLATLLAAGVSETDLTTMVRRNPALILGLDG